MKKIIRRKETDIPAATAHGWQQDGIYPKFFKVGPKASGLFEDEHDRVMALRAGGASNDEIRSLVDRIHRDRSTEAEKIKSAIASELKEVA